MQLHAGSVTHVSGTKCHLCVGSLTCCVADGVGFEPTDAFTSPVFKTGALNRSATHPSDLLSRGDARAFQAF